MARYCSFIRGPGRKLGAARRVWLLYMCIKLCDLWSAVPSCSIRWHHARIAHRLVISELFRSTRRPRQLTYCRTRRFSVHVTNCARGLGPLRSNRIFRSRLSPLYCVRHCSSPRVLAVCKFNNGTYVFRSRHYIASVSHCFHVGLHCRGPKCTELRFWIVSHRRY